MIVEDIIKEARIVWARKGNTVVKKVRCTSGRRKGRLVSKASQCSAPPDIKKTETVVRAVLAPSPTVEEYSSTDNGEGSDDDMDFLNE